MFAAVILLSCGSEPVPQFEVVNKCPAFTVVNKTDPYAAADYADFKAKAWAAGRGVLVVGVSDKYVGGYTPHYAVPNGFEGLASGEWDYWVQDGKLWQQRKAVSQVKATGKSAGPQTTVAPSVATSPRPAEGTSPSWDTRPRVIYTVAPGAGRWANTDCPPSG